MHEPGRKRSMTSNTWRRQCLAPKANAGVMRLVDPTGDLLPVGCASYTSGVDSDLAASVLPSGTSGQQASLGFRCSLSEPETTYYVDVVIAQVGAVVISYMVEGFGEGPTTDELRISTSLMGRARDAQPH